MATDVNKRYITLLNLDYLPGKNNSDSDGFIDSIYWENSTSDVNFGGRVGHLENSLFYMGFSKNYNNVNKATYYPVEVNTDNGGRYNGGSTCVVEFSQYDSGYDGPMISKEITVNASDKTAYKMSWLNTSPGKSKEIGVFPINIALHTFVDNDIVAQEALAQAWLLKDSNVVASAVNAMTKEDTSTCVYRYHSDKHDLNKPSCIYGLTDPQNKILYNAFSAFRKHTYYKTYGKDGSINTLYISSHKDHERPVNTYPAFSGVPKKSVWPNDCRIKLNSYFKNTYFFITGKDCMNYYDKSKSFAEICSSTYLGDPGSYNLKTYPICSNYESKSYGGGYVSLHHIHFTTAGNTTGDASKGGSTDDSYKTMSFYIPRSTGEAATKIKLADGEYDASTDTTHYWAYFFNSTTTNTEIDGSPDSGWSYDSPINVPVGKVYSKITPVDCTGKTKTVSDSSATPTKEDYLESVKSPDLSSWGIPVNRYVASFTANFNIYIVKEKTSTAKGNIVLGAVSSSGSLQHPSLAQTGAPDIGGGGGGTSGSGGSGSSGGSSSSGTGSSSSEKPRLPDISDTLVTPSTGGLFEDEDDWDSTVDGSTGQYAAVQICSITGVLADYTWAYSHMRSHYRNLYGEALSRGVSSSEIGSDNNPTNKLDVWDRYIESPKLYGLLVLQHCCSDVMKGTNTRYGEDKPANPGDHNIYKFDTLQPGNNKKEGATAFDVISSFEEGQMVLNNGAPIKVTNTNTYAKLGGQERWLKMTPSQTGTDGIKGGTHNIIKVSNHNAKYSLSNVSLTTPSCHNRGLYPAIKQYDTKNTEDTWYQNHVDSNEIDCGAKFENGKFIGLKWTKVDDSNRWSKTVSPNISSAGNVVMHRTDYDLGNGNLPAVTGKLGKLDLTVKAEFSIVKDSIMINGIPLNKMATKFPLEHRDVKIRNVITFKLDIDFTKGPGRLDNNKLKNTTDELYILPTYTLYDDDLRTNAVGNLKEIILPTNYNDTFPYYNVSLRLPLTSIDDNFCKYTGSNKFLGATCYDINEDYFVLEENPDSSAFYKKLSQEQLLTDEYLTGIKYDFKILEISKKVNESDNLEKETLTCALTFFNDDNTFGFLDFSFAIPTYTVDSKDLDIEGTAVLSDMMNKIIIKGIPTDDNNFVFSESEFNISIKKSLNTDVANSITAYDGVNETPPSEDDTSPSDEQNVVTGLEGKDGEMMYSDENGVMNVQDNKDEESEVRINSEYVIVVNRSTGEVQGVGNSSLINYDDYGKYVGFEEGDTAGNNELYRNKGYGMYNIKGRCLTNDFLPLLSNKIVVY